MKKKHVKFLCVAVLACLTLGAFAGCKGCGKENGKSSSPQVETVLPTITLDRTQMTLKVGDVSYLVANYAAQDGVSVSYRSSDDTVASVNEHGEVTANKEGTAEITVTYGEATATCVVSVSLGGELPCVETGSVSEGSVQRITLNDTLEIAPSVRFNGREYDDGKFSYTLGDESVGAVENGVFTPKKKGVTTVTLKGEWRGVQGITLERTFTVEVLADVEISVNGGKNSTFELYTRAEMGDREYVTELPFVLNATEYVGTETIALVSNWEIVSGNELISIENEKIKSLGKSGTAKVFVTCEDTDGKEYQTEIAVNVHQSVGAYAGVVEFSAADGELPLADIFGGDVALVRAEHENDALSISEDKKRVLGLKTLSTGVTETTVTVYDEEVGYEIALNAYTKIVDEAVDFEYFRLNNADVRALGKTFDGYYILANDIDASGYVLGANGFVGTGINNEYKAYGLTGTFDGNGHTVSNLTFGKVAEDFEKFDAEARKSYTYSLFGVIGNGGVVKNVGFDNVTFDVPAEVTKGGQSVLATWIMGGTVENVYIRLNGLQYHDVSWRGTAAIAYSVDNATKLTNCILDVGQDGSVAAAIAKLNGEANLGIAYGSLVADRIPDDETLAKNWKNVYVISDTPLSCYKTEYRDAANIAAETAARKITAVKRYESVADFVSATGNDYSAFAGGGWNVNGNVPVWNGIDLQSYAVLGLGGKNGTEFLFDASDGLGPYELTVQVAGMGVSELTFTSDNACVSVQGATLTLNHVGTANITAEYKFEGKTYSLDCKVNVIVPVEEYTQTITFSAMHGELPLAQIFGDENTQLVLAYQGDKALTIGADKKTVLGVQTTSRTGAEALQLTVYSAMKGYKLHLNAYAGILKEAKDLAVFNLGNFDPTYSNNNVPTVEKKVDGYYVLGGDIDAAGYTLSTQGFISVTHITQYDSTGFVGTFDGQGYTISNLTFGNADTDSVIANADSTEVKGYTYSIFGIIGKGATVKNFAVTGVNFSLPSKATKAVSTTLATWIIGATVENVYVQVQSLPSSLYRMTAPIAYGIYTHGTAATSDPVRLKNVLVDATAISADNFVEGAPHYGSLMARQPALDTNYDLASWSNVYVLASFAVSHTADASNIASATNQYTNVKRYVSVAEMKAAQNDYSSFATSYWTTTSGIPVWN